MNPSPRRPISINLKTRVRERGSPKGDAKFHIILGLAGALSVLAIMVTWILFARESTPEQRLSPASATAANESSPTVADEREPGPTESTRLEPDASRPPKAVGLRQRPVGAGVHKPIRGTISPPAPDAAMADSAAGVAAVAEEDATGEEPDAAQNVPEPALQAEGQEQPAPAGVETRSGGKIKKIFGSLLKPFRNGGRKPDANK